jgi:hypothetical protein
VLVIDVATPLRTDDRYEFECRVRRQRPFRRRLLRPGRSTTLPRDVPPVVRFGFRTSGWRLEHHPVWDAIYPLMSLTRNGGPLFGTRHHRAAIRMAYPTPAAVRDFFVGRAHDLGLELTIEGRASGATFDGSADGRVVAFGGGKESRAILGMLRETGHDPVVVSSWARNVPDLPDALVSDPMGVALVDRMMPALMRRGRDLYLGGTLGGSHRTVPWHRYYDVSSPGPLRETSRMLRSVGLPTTLHSPLAIAPPNIGQWVLHDRYPTLYRHQYSTRDDGPTEKNLHVALCKLHHDIAYQRHCPPELFARLLDRFVTRETARPDDFGSRSERQVISREMRAIIHRHRARAEFAGVRDRVPDDWAGDWIDHLHPYVEPEPQQAIVDILAGYARPIDQASPGARLWRIPV